MFNILLIAGHGGTDPGACAFGRKEADLAREFVTLLQKELLKYECKCGVYNMARSMYHDLIVEGYHYNFVPYNYVLEVHFDAYENDPGDGKNKGSGIFVTYDEKAVTVEEKILKAMASFGFKNRGVKRKNFSVIAEAKRQGVSSALFETCFIDDADDMAIYIKNKSAIAEKVAEAIADEYKLKKKEGASVGFVDTQNHWAKAEIEKVATAGLMKGYADNTFKPDKPVTRAELATVLARLGK